MIYLCSVYSLGHKTDSQEDIEVREERFNYVCSVAAELMKRGQHVYSPIAHNHVIAKASNLPATWDFWGPLDKHMIQRSDYVAVLKMKGWEDSEGITDEIIYARSIGKPVVFLPAYDYTGR